MFHFYTSENIRKPPVFCFQGGIKVEQGLKMGERLIVSFYLSYRILMLLLLLSEFKQINFSFPRNHQKTMMISGEIDVIKFA